MARGTVADDGAVLHLPTVGPFVGFPAFERFAVEHADPAIFPWLGGVLRRRRTRRYRERGKQQGHYSFHARHFIRREVRGSRVSVFASGGILRKGVLRDGRRTSDSRCVFRI